MSDRYCCDYEGDPRIEPIKCKRCGDVIDVRNNPLFKLLVDEP